MTDEVTSLNVTLSFVENSHTSISQVSNETGVSRISVDNATLEVSFIKNEELSEDYCDRRLTFADRTEARTNFLIEIVFSDEATFQLNRIVTLHNCRFSAPKNPHWFMESHSQHRQK